MDVIHIIEVSVATTVVATAIIVAIWIGIREFFIKPRQEEPEVFTIIDRSTAGSVIPRVDVTIQSSKHKDGVVKKSIFQDKHPKLYSDIVNYKVNELQGRIITLKTA